MKHLSLLLAAFLCCAFYLGACSTDSGNKVKGTDEEGNGGTSVSSQMDFSRLTSDNHPRVVFTDDDFAAIAEMVKAGTNPDLSAMHAAIIRNADSYISASDLERTLIGVRLLTVCRNAEKRILYCAYAYKTTGEKKYLERAEYDLQSVCSFEDWNCPQHTLDVGEMSTAVGLGYDWLYNDLKEETKVLIRKALNDFAFTPVANGEVNNDFYSLTNNWNAVCNGGLVSAALAVYEDNQSVAKSFIDKGVSSNVAAQRNCYYPDGTYPEGYSYWNYGTIYEALLLTALETAVGYDNGLSEAEGFSETGKYVTSMIGPSGYCFNYSDCEQSTSPCMALWYFTWKFGDKSILFLEKKNVSDYESSDESRLLPLVAWYASKVDVTDVSAPTERLFYGHGSTPVVLIHDTWTMDEDDKFLGIKGGCGTTTHAHLDAGSFVFDAEGVRWAADLGMQSYNAAESNMSGFWNTADGSNRWTVFRLNNFNHNTITINNAYHLSAGVGTFTDIFEDETRIGATIDISPVFGTSVSSAVRTVYIEGDDLVVEDRIIAPSNNSASVRWTMVTQAEPTIEYGIVTLKQGRKIRYMTYSSSTGHKIIWDTWSTVGSYSFEDSNDGFYECGYTVSVNPGTTAVITIRLTPTDPL